jgi:hypothetical protein
MYLSIEEAHEAIITRKQTEEFIQEHGLSLAEFLQDCGDSQTYTGKVILDWAGY